ncbi:Trans-enoyl reductase TOXD [Exophiala dermatitidis]
MKAVVMTGEPGKATLVTDRPFPRPRPGYVLADVKAVALNPTDWKHTDFFNSKDTLLGCDFAGVVAQTGTGYSKQWKVGDRICGFVSGGNALEREDGAFAERVAVKADVALRIPDNMSFEEASSLPVAIVTVGQGLFQQMGLNRPSQPTTEKEFILIYGGSTLIGTMAIQLAKLAGYTPIATCSPHNFELVKSMGAVAAFDYKDPNCVAQIKEFTNNNLKYVWDAISLPPTAQLCAQVIAPNGRYGTILPVDFPRKDVKQTHSVAYTAFGEPVKKPFFEAQDTTADFEFMKGWIAEAEGLLHQGQLKHHPLKIGRGLENVLEGMDQLRQDKVSGQKLVYVL